MQIRAKIKRHRYYILHLLLGKLALLHPVLYKTVHFALLNNFFKAFYTWNSQIFCTVDPAIKKPNRNEYVRNMWASNKDKVVLLPFAWRQLMSPKPFSKPPASISVCTMGSFLLLSILPWENLPTTYPPLGSLKMVNSIVSCQHHHRKPMASIEKETGTFKLTKN